MCILISVRQEVKIIDTSVDLHKVEIAIYPDVYGPL